MRFGLVVEGHGDELAMPILVRRIAERNGVYDLEVNRPFRVARGKFSESFDDFDRAVRLLSLKSDVILAVLDSDDDCPVELARGLTERGRACCGTARLGVVVAHHEYEAWLIAAAESLEGCQTLVAQSLLSVDPDEVRSPKAMLKNAMTSGKYTETVDQKAFTARMDISEAIVRSRSFRKLTSEVEQLILGES